MQVAGRMVLGHILNDGEISGSFPIRSALGGVFWLEFIRKCSSSRQNENNLNNMLLFIVKMVAK